MTDSKSKFLTLAEELRELMVARKIALDDPSVLDREYRKARESLFDTYDDNEDTILEALELAGKSQWVKCSEKMPEVFRPVICYGEPSRGGYAWSFCTYEGSHIWRFVLDGAENKSKIEYWYPLPAPPKEEGK